MHPSLCFRFRPTTLAALAAWLWLVAGSPAGAQAPAGPIDADLRKLVFAPATLVIAFRAPPELTAIRVGAIGNASARIARPLRGTPVEDFGWWRALGDGRIESSLDVVGIVGPGFVRYRVLRYRDAKSLAARLDELDRLGAEQEPEQGETVRVLRDPDRGLRVMSWTHGDRTLVEGEEDHVVHAIRAAKRVVDRDAPILAEVDSAPAGADVVFAARLDAYRQAAVGFRDQARAAASGEAAFARRPLPAEIALLELVPDSDAFVAAARFDELRGVLTLRPAPGVDVPALRHRVDALLGELRPLWKIGRDLAPTDLVEAFPDLIPSLLDEGDVIVDSLTVADRPDRVRLTFAASTKLSELNAAAKAAPTPRADESPDAKALERAYVLGYSRRMMAGARLNGLPRAIRAADGKPLLSWRVALLRYLDGEGNQLYDRFKFDEPWDSPHNIKLVPRMPSIYQSPGVELEKGKTLWARPMGPGTRHPDEKTDLPHLDEHVDFVELAPDKAVIWTKPDDWVVDPAKPFEGLNAARGGVIVNYYNGAVEKIPLDLPANEWLDLLRPAQPKP